MQTILKLSAILFGLAYSISSAAYTINSYSIDVGNVDDIIATASVGDSFLDGNSPANQKIWVESVLGFEVNFNDKIDGAFSWTQVDDNPNLYAQSLLTDPAYYLIKLGGGSFTGDTHVLYENFDDLSYAVIDLGLLGQGATIDITRISHISEFSVPEPGTLALFGLGLLGLSFVRRRKH